ncbi:MAG TPA: hypothetical protein VNV38_14685 [Stellaceae bacterium]|jgi:hypothetical protein|nr:hypothetical protein [Stellaceae bacterium]
MKITSLILPAINGVVWGGSAWMGWDLIKSVELQHAPGYPNSGQIFLYAIFPLLMLSVSLVPAAFLSQTKWAIIGNIWSVLTLVPFFPYFCSLSGGV